MIHVFSQCQLNEAAQTTLQLGSEAAADDVEHCLSFATWTLISCCKVPLFAAECWLIHGLNGLLVTTDNSRMVQPMTTCRQLP